MVPHLTLPYLTTNVTLAFGFRVSMDMHPRFFSDFRILSDVWNTWTILVCRFVCRYGVYGWVHVMMFRADGRGRQAGSAAKTHKKLSFG